MNNQALNNFVMMYTPCPLSSYSSSLSWLLPLIIALLLWDMVWKAIGMWKAARNNEIAWFIAIALFNTIGLIPIIYLFLDKKKNKDIQ